jgi:hypothetical protein
MQTNAMKAIEVTATIDGQGQLALDQPLELVHRRVRVIVLVSEEDELDPDETPDSIIIEGLRQGLHEAIAGQTVSLSKMWDGIGSRTI